MDTNSLIIYGAVTEVYDELIGFCSVHGFKVKQTKEKYYAITAKRTSLLFWRNLQMELTIMAVEKKKVEVVVMVYQYGIRRPGLEKEYRMAIDKFFSHSH